MRGQVISASDAAVDLGLSRQRVSLLCLARTDPRAVQTGRTRYIPTPVEVLPPSRKR